MVLRDPEGRGPNVSLDHIPEKRTGKEADYTSTSTPATKSARVERLIMLGATRYPWRYRPDDDFVVLADPDDNLFCVVQVASGP